ncbi:hypothetical protein N7U66_19260 [Lacinutrix neustonica]|uniref:Uncharacterized protein n=1 Tax=Lacinutrix neustonica TaxID=2980107 RepID=A0A9E8SE56_9FLAO|nr:hypothetical protein [Lacinutrix neustonica]WAC01954.1 hypothetical protein N7U66_19260 [Lacinutrix neustonica]
MSVSQNIKRTLSKRIKHLKLLVFHSKQLSFKSSPKKRIIICFNGLLPHGGMVDRLKGIISFYDIAKILDYDFFIQFDTPFKLAMFLEPNEVPWQMNREAIKYHPLKTKVVYLVNDFSCNPLQLIQSSKAETYIVYANIDYSSAMYPEWTTQEKEAHWRRNFNALFKKSAFLNHQLKGIEDEKYIALHTRFTSLMGDFKDTTTLILDTEERETLMDALRQKITGILEATPFKCYVFSDSIRFLEYIKDKEPVCVLEGHPFHMDDFAGNTAIAAHLKTLLDFFMIVESEAVYFLKCGNMYHSSFSKYAAIIGNKPFKTITN